MQAIGVTIAVGWLAFLVFWFAIAAGARRTRAYTYSSASIAIRFGIFLLVFFLIRLTGPYRYVRHPIYSGVIVALAGTALAVGLYWLIASVAVSVNFICSARVDEHNLAREFPTTYPAYRKPTKMLIPFIL